jgi:hypothetical protein
LPIRLHGRCSAELSGNRTFCFSPNSVVTAYRFTPWLSTSWRHPTCGLLRKCSTSLSRSPDRFRRHRPGECRSEREKYGGREKHGPHAQMAAHAALARKGRCDMRLQDKTVLITGGTSCHRANLALCVAVSCGSWTPRRRTSSIVLRSAAFEIAAMASRAGTQINRLLILPPGPASPMVWRLGRHRLLRTLRDSP